MNVTIEDVPMSVQLILQQIETLTPAEKLDLVFQIWNRLDDSERRAALPDSHADVIDRRVEGLNTDPLSTLSWNEVVANVRGEP